MPKITQSISKTKLPSRGDYYTNKFDLIELSVYTYKDILEYNEYQSHNYLYELLRDIKTLQIVDSDDLLLFDLPALSFAKKCLSITEGLELKFNFTCAHCKSRAVSMINLLDIDFKSELKLPDILVLGEDEFKITPPTLKYTKDVINMFLAYNEIPYKEVFLLCCYLGFLENPNRVKYAIENSSRKSIYDLLLLIDNIDSLLPTNIKCSLCLKESVVRVNSLTTDLFSLFRVNY